MSKKNIDNLFQEKLRDFGETPDERVWKAIASSLDKKEKSRKVIPIWWKLGGAAAVLAFVLYLVNPVHELPNSENTITTKEKTGAPKTKDSTNAEKQELFAVPDEAVEKIADVENSDHSDSKQDIVKTPATAGKPNLNSYKNNANAQNSAITYKNQEKNSNFSKDTDVLNKNDGAVIAEMKSPEIKKNVEENSTSEGKRELSIAENQEAKNSPVGEELAENNLNKKDVQTKKSIFDEIERLEEEDMVEEKSGGKWSVGPSVAPVYFDAIGQGSPIHSDFSSNSKSGQTNLSYGVVVAYELNKKLKVRSGVHKVDYGYNTNEVAFSSAADFSSSQVSISNIDYSLASRNIVVSSKKETPLATENLVALDASAREPSRDGRMTQQFGYLEIPVELNYALLDNKFGINLIGGISSLFLTNNSIHLESNNLLTEVGEANNINNVNFSTNFGFGVNYRFTPQLQLNVEPIFKYQLNTFSETAGNFNPFSVGIYSGINFRF